MARVTFVVLALLLWTLAVVAGVAILFPGQVPPCPEAAPIGLSDPEREAIFAMCARRAQVGLGPLIGIPIWIAGVLVMSGIAVVANRVRHSGTRIRGS